MQKRHNEGFIRINGWRFYFDKMRAMRLSKCRGDISVEKCSFRIFEGKVYKSDLYLPGFFDIPEHKFDEKIIKAYIDYQFEKQLLE